MARQIWRGGAMLAPLPPALVTCGTEEQPNILTVAWTGILSTQPPVTYISVRPSRFSHALIEQNGCFAINLCTEALVRAADFCGMYTGAKVDKFARMHLHPTPSSAILSPSLLESPLTLECRVREKLSLGTHDMFLSDIVAVTVDDRLLDEQGKLHLERAHLCAYAHGEYFALGRRLGKFGFSAVKRNSHAPEHPRRTEGHHGKHR